MTLRHLVLLAMCVWVSACTVPPTAPTIAPSALGASAQNAVHSRTFFYAGGQYTGPQNQQVMTGQMYTEVWRPQRVQRPYPLVLVHGAAQTATNWMGTPDGREGWAHYFVRQGYVVVIIDQAMRGRSAWHPSDGATRMFSAQAIESQFTATAEAGLWPQAKRHTQWPGEGPGKGKRGDPVFDAFYATQVESLASNTDTQIHNQKALAAVLDQVGPAVVLTHSQAGPLGWLVADARPALVKAIVAVEPSGPPFENAITGTGPARLWGPTDVALNYTPALSDPSELRLEKQAAPSPELTACWLQREPARRLTHLSQIPVMVMTAEASYHAAYDHCTANYLAQAGVPTDFIRLETLGLRGNGHMVMLEKNNLAIAQVIDAWLQRQLK